ncbi:MAG TPA: hypothetical protein QGH18_05675, partial [Arenicellales bacterium]|nr:hypothetical protein [Arenicellales bacterium]
RGILRWFFRQTQAAAYSHVGNSQANQRTPGQAQARAPPVETFSVWFCHSSFKPTPDPSILG